MLQRSRPEPARTFILSAARYDPFHKFNPNTGKRNGTSTARFAPSLMTAFPCTTRSPYPDWDYGYWALSGLAGLSVPTHS